MLRKVNNGIFLPCSGYTFDTFILTEAREMDLSERIHHTKKPRDRANLTEAAISKLKPMERDYMLGCGHGVWLRVRSTGRKTFIIRRKEAGRTKIITLGDWPSMSLRQALALSFTTSTPHDATISNLIEQYQQVVIAKHARPKQFSPYAKRMRAALGSRRVSEITTKALSALVADSRSTPRAADSLRSHLRAMFGLAMELGWRADNPALPIGSRVTGYTYKPRERTSY
jgi:hypothetical protein